MKIESPFGEYSDYAVIRLTRPEVLELKNVLDRMLLEGPSVDFRAYVPPSSISEQIEVTWDRSDSV
ncbi:MAG TPA: hypothetical protein VLZ77_13640 [Acidimicrobiales bacterium]|nr:hypothetical protein [Acidimicrobiales bacterium]